MKAIFIIEKPAYNLVMNELYKFDDVFWGIKFDLGITNLVAKEASINNRELQSYIVNKKIDLKGLVSIYVKQ